MPPAMPHVSPFFRLPLRCIVHSPDAITLDDDAAAGEPVIRMKRLRRLHVIAASRYFEIVDA